MVLELSRKRARNMRSSAGFSGLFLGALVACGGAGKSRESPAKEPVAEDASTPPSPDGASPESPPPEGECADVGSFYASHAAPRPGGSELGLVLEPAGSGGLDGPRDYAACIEGDVAVQRRDFAGALVMLLVRPDAAPADSLKALDLFLAARPAGEAIGALLWTEQGTLTIDVPGHDRERTRTRIERALRESPAQ
jgi:hypothetical protein